MPPADGEQATTQTTTPSTSPRWEELSDTSSVGSIVSDATPSGGHENVLFEFGADFVPPPEVNHADGDIGSAFCADSWLSESETSAETVRTGGFSRRRDAKDPAPAYLQGPPFAVGDLVVVDLEKAGMLEKACVVEAKHPHYVLHMEDGRSVAADSMTSALFPKSIKPGDEGFMDFDESTSMKEFRRDLGARGQLGSFGIQLDSQLHSLRRIKEEKKYAKAVKADDAAIPVHLWNDRVTIPGFSRQKRDKVLGHLRVLAHRHFLATLVRDCHEFMNQSHGHDWKQKLNGSHASREATVDYAAVRGVLWHAGHTNWFEYHRGSRLVHFRFPKRYRKLARDGVPVFFETEGPTSRAKQPKIQDPTRRRLVSEKLAKVLSRRYLLPTTKLPTSLIKFFDVPKGEDDIRLVYDGTANGLNACVWVPSFWLPTVDSLLRALDAGSCMTDRDVADMFLNFQLHHSVVPFTGVDMSGLGIDGSDAGVTQTLPRWACWDRNLMGFAASPYNSIKMALIVEEVVRGDRHETRLGANGAQLNPFQWASVRLNLPGQSGYDPTLSWICKLRADGLLASELFTFVDDERVTGATRELAWEASHRLASVQSYLGVQDAARKARPCSPTPGAWAGSVVHVHDGLGVCTLVSEEKWKRFKAIIDKWKKQVDEGANKLNHKELLSDRGFLVYVTMTYATMIPYLKGIHLTLEMWRGGRDAEGYKLDTNVVNQEMDPTQSHEEDTEIDPGPIEAGGLHAPIDGLTPVVSRLSQDLDALHKLTRFDLPPLRVVRPSKAVHVFYGFADASGKQFGQTQSGNLNCRSQFGREHNTSSGISYRLGIWPAEVEQESSNYKELRNLVEATEAEAKAGRLSNCEYFLFTDNSTAEGCFYRGSSKSKRLHELILRLKLLEMSYNLLIHVIHVSGKRMISQGTDGCSRGSLMEGVMAGHDMLSYVDLDKSAIERSPTLLDWIRKWTDQSALEPLTPEGWFEEGHGIVGGDYDKHGVWIPAHEPKGKMHLWAPPPAVADAALEELLKARHKRTDTYHVIVIPRLMLPRWRRLFNKACDFSFEVPIGAHHWPSSMFEPLWVGILLPFTHHRPWSLHRAPVLVDMAGELRRLLVAGEGDGCHLLRKLLLLPRRLASMREGMARVLLQMPRPGNLPDSTCGR